MMGNPWPSVLSERPGGIVRGRLEAIDYAQAAAGAATEQYSKVLLAAETTP
jgi:hypothetical protein